MKFTHCCKTPQTCSRSDGDESTCTDERKDHVPKLAAASLLFRRKRALLSKSKHLVQKQAERVFHSLSSTQTSSLTSLFHHLEEVHSALQAEVTTGYPGETGTATFCPGSITASSLMERRAQLKLRVCI